MLQVNQNTNQTSSPGSLRKIARQSAILEPKIVSGQLWTRHDDNRATARRSDQPQPQQPEEWNRAFLSSMEWIILHWTAFRFPAMRCQSRFFLTYFTSNLTNFRFRRTIFDALSRKITPQARKIAILKPFLLTRRDFWRIFKTNKKTLVSTQISRVYTVWWLI